MTVANSGGAPLPAGTVFEVRSGQVDMPFKSGDSALFDCVDGPGDVQRAVCTSTAALAAGATESVPIIFTVGAGQRAGCPASLAAPCALLDVAWIDAATPTIRVPVAQLADTVGEPTNPIPPDATVQLTTPSVSWQGQATPLRVMVANAGLGPTTDPITVTLDLPAGFILDGSSAPGWTCNIVTAPITCTRNASLAAGAHTSTITVTARVGATAVDGTAFATVTTLGDSDPSNNTMSRTLKVINGDPDDPDGPGHFTIEVDGPMTISPGGTAPTKVNLQNHGTTEVDGPHTVAMLVPDGLLAGQVVNVGAEPSSWTCTDTALVGVREFRCTVDGTIAAGSASPDLDLNITGTELSAGTTLDLTLSNDLDGTPVHLVNRLLVTTPRVAQFAMAS